MGTRVLARTALLIALTTVATMIIRIPNPATQGYINLGDTMIFAIALVFGGRAGGLAGGLGSALADGLSGYFIWAPWTLIIKGIEGFLIGVLAQKAQETYQGKRRRLIEIGILILGGAWMILGYYIAGTLLLGATAALTEIPGNIFQAAAGLIIAMPIASVLRRMLKQEQSWT